MKKFLSAFSIFLIGTLISVLVSFLLSATFGVTVKMFYWVYFDYNLSIPPSVAWTVLTLFFLACMTGVFFFMTDQIASDEN